MVSHLQPNLHTGTVPGVVGKFVELEEEGGED